MQQDKLRVIPRHATLDQWNKSEDIPLENEILVVNEVHEEMEPSFKLGDGKHKFKDLPYVTWDYAFKNGILYVRSGGPITKVQIEI